MRQVATRLKTEFSHTMLIRESCGAVRGIGGREGGSWRKGSASPDDLNAFTSIRRSDVSETALSTIRDIEDKLQCLLA